MFSNVQCYGACVAVLMLLTYCDCAWSSAQTRLEVHNRRDLKAGHRLRRLRCLRWCGFFKGRCRWRRSCQWPSKLRTAGTQDFSDPSLSLSRSLFFQKRKLKMLLLQKSPFDPFRDCQGPWSKLLCYDGLCCSHSPTTQELGKQTLPESGTTDKPACRCSTLGYLYVGGPGQGCTRPVGFP